MKVLLISVDTESGPARVLPLGLGHVAAAARRAGHETALLRVAASDDPVASVARAVAAAAPDVVGVSVRNVDDQSREAPRFLLARAREVVDACRAATAAPVVVGGAGYSIFPDAALAYLGADAGIRGEGEAVFPELLRRLERSEVLTGLPGVHLPGGPPAIAPATVGDLDALPLPDDDAWTGADPTDPDLFVPVQTRRGCPLDCSYCATAAIEGRAVRFRSPGKVADHLSGLVGAGFRRAFFVDNTFNLPADYALALCREIASRQLPLRWRCIVYPYGMTEGLARAMAEAGCVEASVGFESGSPPVLRKMGKLFSPEDVRATTDLLASHGIRRNGFLLLGGPGETTETLRESVAFAGSLGLDSLKVTVGLRIYPGTPLARTAVAEGVVAPDEDLLAPRFYLAPGIDPLALPGVT